MVNNTLIYEDIAQLLQDADCPDAFIQQFLAAMETDNVTDQLRLLRTQRCRQLDRVHEEEKKLDCLDYLRYKLEKQLPVGTGNNRKGPQL